LTQRWLRIHRDDNVAIVLDPDGVIAPSGEHVPQSNKIALGDFAAGAPVLRYGQVIGFANRSVPAGSWVRNEFVDEPVAPALDELPLATRVPEPLPPLEGYTFEGYRNEDGSVGTRNLLGITTTVQCVAPTVDYAVRRIEAEILPRFPNVNGVVAITHTYGCGVAIDAPGAAVPIRTIANLVRHANLGDDPLIVSLGCEKLQPARLGLPVLQDDGVLRLQDLRGVGVVGWAAVRRKRCILGRDVQSRGWLCGGFAGACGRDRDVF
jgi:galactarate dehydratase